MLNCTVSAQCSTDRLTNDLTGASFISCEDKDFRCRQVRGPVQSDAFTTSEPKPVFLTVCFIKSQLRGLPAANQLQQHKLEGQDGKYANGNGPALVYSNIHVLSKKKKKVGSRKF
jgi:hypothetical protein